MSKFTTLKVGATSAVVAFLAASPALAQAAAPDPQLAVVPLAERLTLAGVFGNAAIVVQLVMASLMLAIVVSVMLWTVQLLRRSDGRGDGPASARVFLSAVAGAGPLLGLFGSAYGLLNSFIGVANVRPVPSLSILAPGFAEASLSAGLGLLAAAIAVIVRSHLDAKILGLGQAAADRATSTASLPSSLRLAPASV